jgi:hypothetical protein
VRGSTIKPSWPWELQLWQRETSQTKLRNTNHKQAGTCIVKGRLALLSSVTGEMKSVSSFDSTFSSSSRASSVYRFCLYSAPTKERFKMKTKQRKEIRKSALSYLYFSPMEDYSWILCCASKCVLWAHAQAQTTSNSVGFSILTMTMNISVLWNKMSYSLAKADRRFGGMYYLHIDGWSVS